MKLKIPITGIKYDSLVNKAGLDQSYDGLSVFFLSKMKNMRFYNVYSNCDLDSFLGAKNIGDQRIQTPFFKFYFALIGRRAEFSTNQRLVRSLF